MTTLDRAGIMSRLSQSPPQLPEGARKPSAVLIPIIGTDKLSVLFTQRTDDLGSHAGQVCFPGGRFQAGDPDLAFTALRETEEEIGLSPEKVIVGGYLDLYPTVTGYTVLPVVGFAAATGPLTPQAREVADIFEVPLPFLIDPKNRERREIMRNGQVRNTYVIAFGRHTIWGATAGMIVNFAQKLGAAP